MGHHKFHIEPTEEIGHHGPLLQKTVLTPHYHVSSLFRLWMEDLGRIVNSSLLYHDQDELNLLRV